MKKLKIISNFDCVLGRHKWKRVDKEIKLILPDNTSKTFSIMRHYRICTKCHKCQYGMYDFQSPSWHNTPEEEIDKLFNEFRDLKLQKIKSKIK